MLSQARKPAPGLRVANLRFPRGPILQFLVVLPQFSASRQPLSRRRVAHSRHASFASPGCAVTVPAPPLLVCSPSSEPFAPNYASPFQCLFSVAIRAYFTIDEKENGFVGHVKNYQPPHDRKKRITRSSSNFGGNDDGDTQDGGENRQRCQDPPSVIRGWHENSPSIFSVHPISPSSVSPCRGENEAMFHVLAEASDVTLPVLFSAICAFASCGDLASVSPRSSYPLSCKLDSLHAFPLNPGTNHNAK